MLDFSVTCIGSALFQHCPGEAGGRMDPCRNRNQNWLVFIWSVESDVRGG